MILLVYSLIILFPPRLIFFIQPLAAKTVLLVLGGAPYVWNGCMVFFQGILLLGYIYAHLLNGGNSVKRNMLIHLGLFLAILILALPIDTNSLIIGGAEAQNPLLWLLSSLFIVLGLPFFIISATSPLTQSWFARTNSKWRERPYMLYSASNLGSFAGLLAYPLVFEPFFNTTVQARTIHYGFIALFVLLAAGAVYMFKKGEVAILDKKLVAEKTSRYQKFRWVFIAFVPSGLLYALTMYVTTDIASFPLLWVIPLALYILSFVLVFSECGKWFSGSKLIHFALATALLMQTAFSININAVLIPLLFLMFFGLCMICHGKLYAERPQQNHNLTKFYIFTSLGGVLGGLFNTFIAPVVFNSVTEFPLLIILSLAIWIKKDELVPANFFKNIIRPLIILGAILIVISTALFLNSSYDIIHLISEPVQQKIKSMLIGLLTCFAILIIVLNARNSTIAIVILLFFFMLSQSITISYLPGKLIYQERNIFGVNRVTEDNVEKIRYFLHGTTIHGIQSFAGKYDLQPTSYYYPLIKVFPLIKPDKPIAVLGQGVGTIACYAKANQQVDFYEIDILVSQIAKKYFTYMGKCPGKKNIIIGDGRVNISKQPEEKYGLIILDAFSSDSVPVHLITREAIEMYSTKLAENGIIAANISNRYIDIAPVLSSIAHSLGYSAMLLDYNPPKNIPLSTRSIWVTISKKPETLEPLLKSQDGWKKLEISDPKQLWTDNYSNIIRSLK